MSISYCHMLYQTLQSPTTTKPRIYLRISHEFWSDERVELTALMWLVSVLCFLRCRRIIRLLSNHSPHAPQLDGFVAAACCGTRVVDSCLRRIADACCGSDAGGFGHIALLVLWHENPSKNPTRYLGCSSLWYPAWQGLGRCHKGTVRVALFNAACTALCLLFVSSEARVCQRACQTLCQRDCVTCQQRLVTDIDR
jgi:hypothetical protein